MNTITINDTNLSDKDIQKFGSKVRAILLSGSKILVSSYSGIIILPGGSIEARETETDAIVRELKEETGIIYNINDLEKILSLEYYQPNYPTRRNEIINRLIKTSYYLGQYNGIDINNTSRTESEITGNFNLQLIELEELAKSINKPSYNPRKAYFDRENQEVIKILRKIRKF